VACRGSRGDSPYRVYRIWHSDSHIPTDSQLPGCLLLHNRGHSRPAFLHDVRKAIGFGRVLFAGRMIICNDISNRAQMHIFFVRQDLQDKEDFLPFQKKGKNRNPSPREAPF
jgi:hypothetical protein